MKFDAATLLPVIIGMVLYLAVAKASTASGGITGMKPVDDVVSMMKKNSDSFMVGVMLTGAIIFVSNAVALKYI